MLEELTIQNLALIEQVSIQFTKGLNCLTGETGAGKSILAGALGLVRGNKGELDQIRSGVDEGSVSAVFVVEPTNPAKDWLAERGLSLDDGRLLIRRVLRRSGKASIFVQGQPITLKDLSDLCSTLFDMHGQHEHQNLFVVDNHRQWLDRFGGFDGQVAQLYQTFGELAGLIKQRDALLADEQDLARKADYLGFAVKEIEQAALQSDEEAELETERRVAGQAEKIASLAAIAVGGLSEEEGGGLALVGAANHALHDMGVIDPSLAEAAGRLKEAYLELQDLSRTVQSYQESIQFDNRRLDEIEDRLALIARLKKKYGADIAAVLAFGDQARTELDGLGNLDERKARLGVAIGDLEKKVLAMAAVISGKRKEAAGKLKAVIEKDLAALGMGKARFEVALARKESDRGTPVYGPYGFDVVEFLMSANPGEPLKPIRSVASGGELSRVMLAIKAALADSDQVAMLVFDEVDSGIGGEVAVAVGEHLRKLARSKQILSITHLASIAVQADNHCSVAKRQLGERTVTQVTPVTGAARVDEIARMLSGSTTVDASRKHAEELLARYHSTY